MIIKLYVVDVWDGQQWHVVKNLHNVEPFVHTVYGNASGLRDQVQQVIKSMPGHAVRIRTVNVDIDPPAPTERGTEHDR